MGKRLTDNEKKERVIVKLYSKIKNLEKIYGTPNVRSACFRFYTRRGNELKLKREIKEKEHILEELKKRAK